MAVKKPLVIFLFGLLSIAHCTDITNQVFGKIRDGLPAAFGDFNSDELTDVFVIRNRHHTVEILLAADEEPFLRNSNLKCNFSQMITSVVPGDFDGDAFMDVMVTTANSLGDKDNTVHILYGGLNHLNCSDELKPVLKVRGQPLAIDYDQDMVIDLFGVDTDMRKRNFWVFNSTRKAPHKIPMQDYPTDNNLNHPHSNAFLDLNEDHRPDLFITGKEQFEIWLGTEDNSYKLKETYNIVENHFKHIGQSIFVDIELKGKLELLLPVCKDEYCLASALYLRTGKENWHDLQINLRDPDGVQWRFIPPNPNKFYIDAITVRSGDYNMDGYPDLIATFEADKKKSRAFLLENVACGGSHRCGNKTSRTFLVRWDIPITGNNNPVYAAAFYDFYQDGILDVLVSYEDGQMGAFKNGLDYDANFVKVMVLTGLSNGRSPPVIGRLGKRKRRTYGTNLPGPTVSYRTTTQEGELQHGSSPQLPQSAHNALGLPFTIFGLGRTPNFVDSLTVGLSGKSRSWTQIIPNSQMVVIPYPTKEPLKWRAQLFVTPSKLILMSVAALTGICGLITLIIGALYWRERQEDKKERLQESHRFHFDAM